MQSTDNSENNVRSYCQPILTSVNTDSDFGVIWVSFTESREDCRDGDSVSNFLPDFVFTYSYSWTDFFGVAFLVTDDVSDLRLECDFFADVITVSDLLVNFSALLLFLDGVRDGDFERLRDGLFDADLLWPLAGDFDLVRPLCS